MPDLSSILGTKPVVEQITKLLSNDTSCSLGIIAEPGRGKTWILDQLDEHISSGTVACIQLLGEEALANEPFYPFKKFIETKDKKYNKGLSALKETVGEIPYIGKGLKVLVKDYSFRKEKSKQVINNVDPFRKHLPFSLHLIGLLRKYDKVLILADDITYFDKETLFFLAFLNTGLAEVGLPLNVSLVYTGLAKMDISFSFGKLQEIELPALTKLQLRQALEHWSECKVADSDVDIIVSSTGGHLQLVKIAANYVKEAGSIRTHGDWKQMLFWLIDARLKSAKEQYQKLKLLILALHRSGKKSSTTELVCLLDGDKETSDLIRKGVQLNILKIHGNYVHFAHPIVDEYIEEFRSKYNMDFYSKLSECIKKITPANYVRRAMIEQLCQRTELADVYWGLAAIQKFRQGYISEGHFLIDRVSNSIEGEEIRNALVQFSSCYMHSLQGLIDEVILELESIPNTLPRLLLAERYYLKCLNLAKRIANNAKEEVLSIVDDWDELKDEEPEIWYNFLQIKIIAAAELGKLGIAMKTEGAIIKYYSSRLSIDPNARPILERLNLFSEVLYTPEIAHKKMLHTEDQLIKALDREQFDRIIDLYISRTNLSSNSFMLNDFEKSLRFSGGAISILNDYPEIQFPYPEAAQSNLFLSLLFSDLSQLAYVIEQYIHLLANVPTQENKILLTINMAGFYVLNNNLSAALQVLQSSDYIPKLPDDDWYYCYYYWVNYALICHMMGDSENAKIAVESVHDAAPNVSKFLDKYYIRHYQLIKEEIYASVGTSLEQVQSHIHLKAPVFSSKIWERFKKAYLFTDIQIWTTS